MSKKSARGIEVYLRIRPSKKSYQGLGKFSSIIVLNCNLIVLDQENNEVQFNFPKDG